MSSPLSLRALALMQQQINDGVRGGQPRRFEGPEVTKYLAAVNIDFPAPWCAADVFYVHAQAETPSEPSHCPRTAGAIHMAERAPPWTRLSGPQPGAVGVLKHRDGHTGHVVMCEYVGPLPGQITSVEGDTNGAGSSTGDAAGRHTWEPGKDDRGTVLGWFDMGLQPPGQAA